MTNHKTNAVLDAAELAVTAGAGLADPHEVAASSAAVSVPAAGDDS